MKKEKNIHDFKVPESYFETLGERLFGKLAEEQFPNSAGFEVPDTYFDSLEDHILSTVIASEKPKKVIVLFPKKYFSYAAAIAACLLVSFMIFKNKPTNTISIDSLQLATIDQYINDGNLDMDVYDVSEYINDNDISDVNFKAQQFSETELKNYLLDNIDDETILNQE